MNPEPPLFVSRLDPHIPPRVQRLRQLDVPHFTAADKREATAVLAEALHGILDTVFTQLVLDIEDSYGAPGAHTRALHSAHDTINDVKYRIDHYLGWVIKFLSNKRLVPGIAHYETMVHELPDAGLAFAGFSVPKELGGRAEVELREMKAGTRTESSEGIELLIEFLDVSSDPIIREPIELMRFNKVVTKTLYGVLNFAQGHIRKELRKLPSVMPPELLPLLARHMENFLVFEESELQEKLERAPEPGSVAARQGRG